MLLAKCCHDLDIMMWMMAETKPTAVSSFGGKFQFKPENAPADAGTRCMVDCPLVDTCRYSCKRLYVDHPDRWSFYVWDKLEGIENPTIEDKIHLLKGDSPYGRCIYKCDNDVVDHQSVMVQFASGATGTHNMVGGSSAPCAVFTSSAPRARSTATLRSPSSMYPKSTLPTPTTASAKLRKWI